MRIIQAVFEGTTPSLKIDGDDVEMIYLATDGTGRQVLTGKLDRTKRQVSWKHSPKHTVRKLFPADTTTCAARSVRAAIDVRGSVGCEIDGVSWEPVRFQQAVFVERQKGEEPDAFRDALFFAAGSSNRADIAQAKSEGLVTRAWGFAVPDIAGPPLAPQENFPATDTPLEQWYQDYLD